MFGVLSIFLILTYHSSVATAWTTVAAVVEFCPSGHCRGGPRYQNDISRIPDRLWKENNVVPFQRFVGANLNWFGARNVQVVASLYYISPPAPPTQPPTYCLKRKMTKTISSLIRSLGLLITLTPQGLSTRQLHCYFIKLGDLVLKPICCLTANISFA